MRTNAIEICCRLIALHFIFLFFFLLKPQFYIFDSFWFILIVSLPNVDLLSELLNIFPSKITKMRNLRCLFYASLQNFGCALTQYENLFRIAQLRDASTESKSILRKLRCASENIKFTVCLLFCAFNGLNSKSLFCWAALFVKFDVCQHLENTILFICNTFFENEKRYK